MGNLATQLQFRRVGEDVQIWERAKILSPETIELGDSVIIDDFVLLMGGRRTVLGSFVHLGAFTSIAGGGELVMEDFSGLSGGVRIYTGNEDYLGHSLTNPTVPLKWRAVTRSSVCIGRHAIVGANAVILPGVVIGEGAAVGAGSVVNKSLEPWTIYAGSPARPVRVRPKETMLAMEAELRQALYDEAGRYVPKARRGGQ